MISHTCSLSYLCSSWKAVSSSPPRLIKQVCKGENFSKRFHLFFCPALTSEPQQQPLETKPGGVCLAPRKMLSAVFEGAKQRSVTVEEDEEERVDGWEGSREVVKRNNVLEGDSVEKVRGGDEYKQAAKVMLIVSGGGGLSINWGRPWEGASQGKNACNYPGGPGVTSSVWFEFMSAAKFGVCHVAPAPKRLPLTPPHSTENIWTDVMLVLQLAEHQVMIHRTGKQSLSVK